ncbi:MAG: hypothetical protein ACYTDT_12115 [Planctomycetota bacterium]|jgi:hypothetical protein
MLYDTSLEFPEDYNLNLSSILSKSVVEVPKDQRQEMKSAIQNFIARAADIERRRTYITQLADGAVSYFALGADPKVAQALRDNVKPTTILLDTNFLFSILGLGREQIATLTQSLVSTINTHNLQFHLRYHPATIKEMLGTFKFYSNRLKQAEWSPAISRASLKAKELSGIELAYHTVNAERNIDVSDFLLKYEHPDEMIKSQGIDIFNAQDNNDKIGQLFSDYSNFLQKHGKSKGDAQITHDMKLLQEMRARRSNASSTLDAGYLLLTCDYTLFTFDWETAEDYGVRPCVILPSQFWQIIRPMVPATADFETAFVEAFALPEFTTISKSLSAAVSRLLGLLGGLKDLTEPIATRLLANRTLIDNISDEVDDATIADLISTELVEDHRRVQQENTKLIRERDEANYKNRVIGDEYTQIQGQLDKIKQRKDATEFELEKSERERRMVAAELEFFKTESKRLAETNAKAAEKTIEEKEKAQKKLQETSEKLESVKTDRDREKARREFRDDAITIVIGAFLAMAAATFVQAYLFEFAVSTYSVIITVAIGVSVWILVVGVLRQKWRKVLLVDVLLVILISLFAAFVEGSLSENGDNVGEGATEDK